MRRNLLTTGFPPDRVQFVEGRVEDTIPARAPSTIGLLRLDTDWYESTRHELEQLWDRLSHGGVLIVDNYGHWRGAREAVDEFFEKRKIAAAVRAARLHRPDAGEVLMWGRSASPEWSALGI